CCHKDVDSFPTRRSADLQGSPLLSFSGLVLLNRRVEAVSVASDGPDPSGISVPVHLATQSADIDVDHVGERIRIVAPDLVEDAGDRMSTRLNSSDVEISY